MTDRKILLINQWKNNPRTLHKIQKIATVQVDDYKIGCLLDYPYFKKHYKLIVIGSSK